jgi:hypothetical protein
MKGARGFLTIRTFKMPKLSRDMVSSQHQRFHGAVSWLIAYLSGTTRYYTIRYFDFTSSFASSSALVPANFMEPLSMT